MVYFDVAYEGIDGDNVHLMVGDNDYDQAKDLQEAIRLDQAKFTHLDEIVLPNNIISGKHLL